MAQSRFVAHGSARNTASSLYDLKVYRGKRLTVRDSVPFTEGFCETATLEELRQTRWMVSQQLEEMQIKRMITRSEGEQVAFDRATGKLFALEEELVRRGALVRNVSSQWYGATLNVQSTVVVQQQVIASDVRLDVREREYSMASTLDPLSPASGHAPGWPIGAVLAEQMLYEAVWELDGRPVVRSTAGVQQSAAWPQMQAVAECVAMGRVALGLLLGLDPLDSAILRRVCSYSMSHPH